MRTLSKIERYKSALARYTQAQIDHNPLVHEPYPEEFGLVSAVEKEMARRLVEKQEKGTK